MFWLKHLLCLLLVFTIVSSSGQLKFQQRETDLKNTRLNTEYVEVLYKENGNYYGEVSIGNPPRKFKVIFDTYSCETWVTSESCGNSCGNVTRFNGKVSSTYNGTKTPKFFTYVGYFLTGTLAQDTFRVGNLEIKNQTFVEIQEVQKSTLSGSFDGIVGLCLTSDVTTPLGNMFSKGLIKDQMFSFYINRDNNNKKANVITFGAVNHDLFDSNSLKFVNAQYNSPYLWSVKIDKIENSNKSNVGWCPLGCQAIISTGISFILGPPLDIQLINQYISDNSLMLNGVYYHECNNGIDKFPTFNFVIGGTVYTMKPSDYILEKYKSKITQKEMCVSAFMFGNIRDTNLWVLGNSFLAPRYTIFRATNASIGFANLKNSSSVILSSPNSGMLMLILWTIHRLIAQ